jgi:hypothetical protein
MKTKINKFIILSFIFSGFALGQDVDTEIAI